MDFSLVTICNTGLSYFDVALAMFFGACGLIVTGFSLRAIWRVSSAVIRTLYNEVQRTRLDRLTPHLDASGINDESIGKKIRVVGHVQGLSMGRSTLGATPAVAWSSAIEVSPDATINPSSGAENFLLRLPDGETLLVRAAAASLQGQWKLAVNRERKWSTQLGKNSPVVTMKELLLQPGDCVEIVGVLNRDIDVHGRANSPRGTPVLWTLSHANGVNLVAREPGLALRQLVVVPLSQGVG